MAKIKFFLTILVLLGLIGVLSSSVRSTQAQSVISVSDLWLDVSLGPPLVDWFNRVASADDIARVENVANLGLLHQITVGRKLVVFKSVAEAESLIPTIADQIDIVGYNLEQGAANLTVEQDDPVASAQRMRDLADEYGLTLAFGPDHFFALNSGVEIAPFVDIFVLQVQRVQTDHRTVREFVLPLAPQLRQANPDLQVTVQVRTEGDVVALVDLVDSMKDHLDGVSILTSPETVSVAEALVEELQMRRFATPRPPASATGTVAAILAELGDAPAAPGNASPATDSGTGFPWLAITLIALTAGAVAGGLVAVLISNSRRQSRGDVDDHSQNR